MKIHNLKMTYYKIIFCLTFLIFLNSRNIMAQITTDIKVPAGFKVEIIAKNIGKARHLAIAPNGDVYIKLLSVKNGHGIVVLKKLKDGTYKISEEFGNYGGTGIAIKDGFLYASSNTTVYRYKFNSNGNIENKNKPDILVDELIDRNEHNSKSLTLDNEGYIYVNMGAYSNACQETNRTKGSVGMKPCPILEHAGGIWRFSINKLNQKLTDGFRYATGLRNVVGLDWNQAANSLFVMQHGRDQLQELYPQFYTQEQSNNLPAECMYQVKIGDNCGWPYSYYDGLKKQIMLMPEYGGDGIKPYTGSALQPTMYFPAHLAPNGLLFYRGGNFPESYKNGAFIVFHGSWNREPVQEGFYVVFAQFDNNKPIDNKWEVFANGFAGKETIESTNEAEHRPCGAAQDLSGNLYISDDNKGFIYKISYDKK